MLGVDFLPFVSFLILRKNIKSNFFIFSYVTLSLFTQITSLILVKNGYQTIDLLFFYNLIITILISFFFYKKIKVSIFFIFTVLAFFLFLFVYFYLINKSLSDFVISVMFYSIFLSAIGLYFYLSSKISVLQIDLNFVYSIIIYNSGAIVMFMIFPLFKSSNLNHLDLSQHH